MASFQPSPNGQVGNKLEEVIREYKESASGCELEYVLPEYVGGTKVWPSLICTTPQVRFEHLCAHHLQMIYRFVLLTILLTKGFNTFS